MILTLDDDTFKALLKVIPNHDRASCSDQQPNNCWTNDQGHPRCKRCFLLAERSMFYTKKVDVSVIVQAVETHQCNCEFCTR